METKNLINEETQSGANYDSWNMPGLNILNSDYYGDDTEGKLRMMATTFNDLYQRTKKELRGLFTLNEVLGIAQAFSGTSLTEFNKEVLLMNIEDSIILDKIDTLVNFDGTILIDKIKNLTQFQCLTVLGMLNKFSMATKDNMISNEDVKKIFMID